MGCYGYKDDDFVLCGGINNIIFTLDGTHIYHQEIMDYLDNCKLFDKPFYDYNAIRNFLARFKQKFDSPLSPTWIERKYNMYQKFAVDHKNCGLVLRLSLESAELPKESNSANILKLVK
jgi:hypothetical protein